MTSTTMKKEFVVEGYVVQDDRLLLIHHKKLALWLPPGGHIKEHETPEDALIREIKEETGFDTEIVRRVKLDHDFPVDILAQPVHIQLENIEGTHEHIDLVYVCRIKDGLLTANDESKDVRFFTSDEIQKLENVPKEVKYFSEKILNRESDRSEYRLPVLRQIINSINDSEADFSNIRLLVVQHIKKNTVEFIRLLKSVHFKEIIIIAKSYSVDEKALQEIEKYCKVFVPPFKELESLKIIHEVVEQVSSLEECFICLDLGGYFSRYFQSLDKTPENLVGIIEDTKNGIWFDEKTIKLKFPLFSVASSELKDYAENYFVAKAIVRNAENILVNSSLSQTLGDKHILILGYGKIGGNIAKILKNESNISVYDKSSIQLLKAKIDGFRVLTDLQQLNDFDVVIGVTGDYVLKKDQLSRLKNGAVLINGSTRKKEFDMDSIKELTKQEREEETYAVYEFHNSKKIYLLAHGFPVNFLGTESIPEFIIDLVFSEVFFLMTILKEKSLEPGFYPVEQFYKHVEEKVADLWVKYWA